jgi:hypothetical protein
MKKRYIATLLTALRKLAQSERPMEIRQVLECGALRCRFPFLSLSKNPQPSIKHAESR